MRSYWLNKKFHHKEKEISFNQLQEIKTKPNVISLKKEEFDKLKIYNLDYVIEELLNALSDKNGTLHIKKGE